VHQASPHDLLLVRPHRIVSRRASCIDRVRACVRCRVYLPYPVLCSFPSYRIIPRKQQPPKSQITSHPANTHASHPQHPFFCAIVLPRAPLIPSPKPQTTTRATTVLGGLFGLLFDPDPATACTCVYFCNLFLLFSIAPLRRHDLILLRARSADARRFIDLGSWEKV
jgi:hypothetical protein